MPRVFITGYGMVSPIGHSVQSSWLNLINGVSGIQSFLNDPILKNQKPYNLSIVKKDSFDFNKWKVPHANNRMNSFLHSATAEAIESSGLSNSLTNANTINPNSPLDLTRCGLVIGNMASSNTTLLQYINQSIDKNFTTINRLSMLQILTNIPCATLNIKYKFQGPSLTVSTACATGLSAVVQAYKLIKLGEADLVIAGATQDVYNALYVNSSLRLQAMTSKDYGGEQMAHRASCPFDKQRSGFVLGEGSGVLVMQSEWHIEKRRQNGDVFDIKAEMLGYGCTSDGFHLTRPEKTGTGQKRAMKLAREMAQVETSEVDQISTHATSTLAGDQIEALAIKEAYGDKVAVTAIKSAIGHTFGAAGSIELILGLKSMQESIMPKIYNLDNPEIQGIDYVRSNREAETKILQKNSFGFGGINVSAIFKRPSS